MAQQPQPDPVTAWLSDLGKDLLAFLRTLFSPEILRRGTGPPPPATTDWEATFPELLDEISEQVASGKRNPAVQRKLAALEQQIGGETFRRRKDYDTFMQILNRVYSPRNQVMIQRLRGLPIFAASRDAWTPGDLTANNNIVHTLLRKVNPFLEEVYGCFAAQVSITDRMRGDLDGLFNPKRRIVVINKGLFHKEFSRFFITFVHEQMHCLQHDLMQRFNDPAQRRSLDPDLAYLVQYWQAERLDYIKCFYLLNKEKKMPDLYFRLGQEVHAEWIGRAVTPDD